jgi:hypothetical protein
LVPAIADDITASPKVRELMDRQKPVAAADNVTVTKDDGILASPKARELLNQQKSVAAPLIVAAKPAMNCPGMTSTAIASPKATENLKFASASSCCGASTCVVACAK